MIEATCTTCGNVNRVSELEIQPGAKFVTCASCKSRVGLPSITQHAVVPGAPVPAPPRRGASEAPGAGASPLEVIPRTGTRLGTPGAGSGRPGSGAELDFMPPDSAFAGAAELPTPKPGGASKLPSTSQPTSPARLNALAISGPGALADAGISDLPAPKSGRTSPAVKVPAPISDLPAPKSKLPTGQRPSGQVSRPPPRPLLDLRPPPKPSGIGELPPSPIGGIGDLPAPKRAGAPDLAALKQGITELPSSRPDLPGPRGVLPELARPTRTDPGLPAASPPAPRQGLDLDLPMPKSSVAPDLPAPRQALELELPMPRTSAAPDLPAPRQALPDLPAPRQALPDLPAPRQALPDLPAPRQALPDLPAPRQALPDLPAPRQALPDLPAPRQGLPDLPAPRQGLPDLPAPRQGLPDLPAPRQGLPDLPAPRQGLPDLPAPRQGLPDLPAPRQGLPDLPAPRQALDNLPTPKPGGAPDLPAPAGFFDDLPQPAVGGAASPAEPPAPKGFFDDLPQPVAAGAASPADVPAPKGFFDDLPDRAHASRPAPAEAPAPKGFFDDLPDRAHASRPAPAEAPAPKGFFDDLPDRAHASRPAPAEAPAPKGFFDDLPDRAHASRPAPAEAPAPKGFFDDLPGRVSPGKPATGAPPPPRGFFDDVTTQARGPLPAGDPAAAPAGDPVATPVAATPSLFDDSVRMNAPAARFTATATTGAAPADAVRDGELDEPRAATPKLEPKRARAARTGDPQTRVGRVRQLRIAAIALIVLAGLGAGGFYVYRRHAAKQERLEEIDQHLSAARAAFAAKDPKRWERAAASARKVLELDEHNAAALGLGAEALLADGVAYGLNANGKAAQARKLLAAAVDADAAGPELERARALSMATAKQPDPAKLVQLRTAAPKDAELALYLGWALAARGDQATAALAFTEASASEPSRILALLGRGRAKLALGDPEGARADFAAVLETAKDHLAAQIGLAAALPAAKAQQQETDLLAILGRKDLAAGDPRAVVQAWLLAAELARRGGRLDEARTRYRKALELAPQDVAALAGLAEVEALDGKLDTAAETIDKALALDPNDVRVLLGFADVAIRQKRLDEAAAKLAALAARKPPPPVLDQARIKLAAGRLLEAQGQDAEAVEAFVEATRLAGELDLTPALTAVAKLGQLAEAASTAKQPDKADELRARGDQLIAPFADNAKQDPQLALALGMAYLQSGDATKAEPWLRRVAEARPADADARYQLAKALARLERYDDAIDALQQAMKLDERRGEIGLELARTYETSGRDAAAGELYEKLLAGPEPSLELRARAGRFFARRGEYAKAGAQGEKIHAADPSHPAGLYLEAEGALAAGKAEEAAKLFRGAVDGDRDPQYLDGQGRAAEALVVQTGDTKFQDVALRAYMAAAELAPTMFNPQVGRGRLHLARREAAKAIPPLLEASKLRPDDPEVTRLIGLAYKELQEKRVAVEWLVRAYRLAPAADTAWHLGQLYSEVNAPREAIAAYANATRLGLDDEKAGGKVPWLTEALYKLGRINMDSGKEKAAKAAWEKFVARNPKPGAQLDEVRRELATTLQRY